MIFLSGLIAILNALLPVIISTTTALLANPLFWGATAVVGITAIITKLKSLKDGFTKTAENVKDLNDAYDEAQGKVENLTSQLETLRDSIRDNEKLKLELTDSEDYDRLTKETDELRRQEAILENQLFIAQEKARIADEERLKEAKKAVKAKATGTIYQESEDGSGSYGRYTSTEDIKTLTQQQIESLDLLNQKFKETQETVTVLKDVGGMALEQANDELYGYQNTIEEIRGQIVDHIDDIEELIEAGGDEDGTLQELVNTYHSLTNAIDGVDTKTKVTADDVEEMADNYSESAEDVKTLKDALEELSKPLTDAEDAYSALQTAVEEFNSTGGISAETVQKLAQLSDDWTSLLEINNGQMAINEEGLNALAEQNRQLAIAELQAQASEDMKQVALGNFNNLSPIAQKAIGELTTENNELAESANEATVSTLLEASAIRELKNAQDNLEGDTRGEAFKDINAIKNEYKKIIDEMNTWSITGGTSSKSGKGSKGSSSEKDKYLEAFKKEKEALKHQLEMDYISEKEYYDSLSELVERYFGVATGLHEKYLDTYQENEEEIYKGLKSIYDEVKDYLAEAVEKSYEDAIKVIEKEEEKVLGTIQKQIDDLKDRKDAHLKSVEKEINALKDQKKTVEDYWDAEIDKIKEANKELEQQNQLLELQKKLAEAKSQKVMVMGEEGTFGLAENEKAVSSAEFNLRKYEDELSYEQQLADMEAMRDAQLQNLQGRIDDLQNYYDYLSEYYENQINALEDYYDKTKEVYQGQIDALQEQLDAFKAGQEEYENIQNTKLANQVMAMDAEAENWNKELANLRNYINQYNSMLTQLGTAGKYVDYSYSAEDGIIPTPTPIGGGVPRHAKGIASVANDEVALVGDSPNRELVLGANVNKLGTLMALSKGSGVVNAESTDTLAGVLNSLASPTASGNGSNVTQTFSFGNISLPNVTDANSFVKELSDKFNNYAIQFSSIRE